VVLTLVIHSEYTELVCDLLSITVLKCRKLFTNSVTKQYGTIEQHLILNVISS